MTLDEIRAKDPSIPNVNIDRRFINRVFITENLTIINLSKLKADYMLSKRSWIGKLNFYLYYYYRKFLEFIKKGQQ
jgi:hypothetical protein